MRTPKHAGFLVDSLSSGVKRIADAPAVKLVGGLANMTEAGRALAGHAGSMVERATDAAKKIEASPAYGVARDVHGLAKDVHGLAQDIRQDPDFRQYVVDPIKAHPLTQVATAVASPLVEGAKGVVHGAVDPMLSRARGAVDQVNQFADSVNRAAEPVIPLVDTAQRVQQKAEAAGQRLDAIKAKADDARARVTEALFPSQTPAALPATSSAPAPAEPAPTAPQAAPAEPAPTAPQASPQAAPASAAPWYKRLYSYLYGITNRYGINDPNTRKSFIDSVISRVMGMFRRQKTSSARVTPRSIHQQVMPYLMGKHGADSGAWQRSEGKNPSGGLNAKGRASLKAQGHDIKPGVRGAADTPEKLRRKGSFLSRMFGPGAPGSMKEDSGKPSRRALSAAAWGESVPKDDAGRARLYAKGQRLLARYKATKQAEAAGHPSTPAAAHGPLSPETLQRLRSAYLREGATAGAIRGALGGALAGYALSDDDDKFKGVLTGAGLGLGAGAGLGGAHGLHLVRGDSPALFVRDFVNEPSYNRESLSLKRPGRFTNELLSTTFHPGDWVHSAQNPNNPKAPSFRLYEDPSSFSKDVISAGGLVVPPPQK
jgi:hypothetical protein